MAPETNTLPLTDQQIAERRAGIEAYLVQSVLATNVAPSDPDSFFQQPPIEDPEMEELWDQAGSDPLLYAIKYAAEHARANLKYYQKHSTPDQIRLAKDQLADAKDLEAYWHDPASSPFAPVKPVEY